MDTITLFLSNNLQIIKKTCKDSDTLSTSFIDKMINLCDSEEVEREIAMKLKTILQIIDKTSANSYTKLLSIFGLLMKAMNVKITQIDCKRAYVAHEFSFIEFDISQNNCDSVSDCKYLNKVIAFCESDSVGEKEDEQSWLSQIVNILKHVKDDSIQPMMKLMCVIGILEESSVF